MRDWHASAGGCTFVFRATYMPWLALAVTVIAFAALTVAIVRWRKQHPPRPPTFGALGVALLAMATSGCGSVKLDEAFRADALFGNLQLTCFGAFVLGLVALVVGIVLVIVYRGMPARSLLGGYAGMAAAVATLFLAILQISELGRAYLPVIDLGAPVGFHAGVQRHVKPQLFHRIVPSGKIPYEDSAWTIDEVVFESAAPGTVERTATARSGPFTVSTTVKAKAHADRGSPWLPLHVGNEWHYALTTTTQSDGTRYFLIFEGSPGAATKKTAGVVIAVEPAPPRDGWHEYTLVVRTADGDSLGHHVVRPIDEETYFYDKSSEEPPDEPDPSDPKCALQKLLDVDPGSAAVRGCRMANMGAGRCQMGGAPEDVIPPPPPEPKPKKPPARPKAGPPPPVPARVPTQYALAGPSHLSTHWESHGGAASWIVGIVTFGMVIPTGMSGGEEYVLMRTVRGP